MALKGSRKKDVISINFEGVSSGGGGGGVHIPEGEYAMKCLEAEERKSESGNQMIAWIFQGTEGKAKGKKFYYYTALVDAALWKVRQTLEGLGVEVPDSVLDVDLSELLGLEGTGIIEDDEYKGKVRSKLSGFVVNGAGGEEEEEEEEEPAPKVKVVSKGKKASKVVKVAADEVNEMSEDELDSLVAKHSLDVDLSEHKVLRKKRAAVVASLEENELLEDIPD